MVKNPEELIEQFLQACSAAGLVVDPRNLSHELQPSPHKPHPLPPGKCAVYVFSLSAFWGARCPARPHRVLKVGKVGPNSNPRFQSQHYNPYSSQSNLARTLMEAKILWPHLGVAQLDEEGVGRWIRENLDRDNFYLGATEALALAELERYVRGRLGPVFEGG